METPPKDFCEIFPESCNGGPMDPGGQEPPPKEGPGGGGSGSGTGVGGGGGGLTGRDYLTNTVNKPFNKAAEKVVQLLPLAKQQIIDKMGFSAKFDPNAKQLMNGELLSHKTDDERRVAFP